MAKTMAQFLLKVAPADQGLRLDRYIIKNLKTKDISRTRIQQLIDSGKITVNPAPARRGWINQRNLKSHYRVKTDDALTINIPPRAKSEVLPQPIPLDILFEDQDLLVINKPQNLISHPAAGVHSGTLVNALLNYGCPLSAINGPLRPGIVHRLDKETTGVMVVAKNDFTHLRLAEQFRDHSIKRKYIAIVKGRVAYNEGVIDYPISRHPQNRRKMTVGYFKKSRPALTRYKVLKRMKAATFLELTPHTGRTHQLRVHLKSLGHPILGDARYGTKASAAGLMLHAQYLGFLHPRREKPVEFKTAIPEHFQELLKAS